MYRVLVLMSTYNGAEYIQEQIDSVLHQKDVSVDLLVRDDGSSDSTTTILDAYRNEGKLDWYGGDNLKPAMSFIDLLFSAKLDYDYYAFCDQDDVWKENKLARTISLIENEVTKPALSYCAVSITNKQLQRIESYFQYNDLAVDFNANLYSFGVAQGCSMVFNKILLKKAREYKPSVVFMHDTWLHKICLLYGGVVMATSEELLLYRQHGKNVIGAYHKPSVSRLRCKECKYSRMYKEIYDHYDESNEKINMKEFRKIVNYRNSIFLRIQLLCSRMPKTIPLKKKITFRRKVLLGTL